ncbi:NUDIX domain-containing protein [Fibrobacter succinogenes]|uniref:NUDIX domain-containing protein n=1 Tax=Fibrobacter succinogenes TaxID=833 RepID=UPI0015680975|nr:NUDIX domain-containing protein [Fibrobacter succinogenes]
MLAVCGIVRQNGRVLVCKRASGMQFSGFWELPTEGLEGDDCTEDALERGFFERLTAKMRALRPVGAIDFTCGEGYRLLAYDVELEKNFFHIYGYNDFRWVKPCHLRRLRVLEPHRVILKGLEFF